MGGMSGFSKLAPQEEEEKGPKWLIRSSLTISKLTLMFDSHDCSSWICSAMTLQKLPDIFLGDSGRCTSIVIGMFSSNEREPVVA